MIIDVEKRIDGKFKKLPSKYRDKISKVIRNLEQAGDLQEVKAEKLTRTPKDYYKIRCGRYRIALRKLSDNHVAITAIIDRKEICNELFEVSFSL